MAEELMEFLSSLLDVETIMDEVRAAEARRGRRDEEPGSTRPDVTAHREKFQRIADDQAAAFEADIRATVLRYRAELLEFVELQRQQMPR
jgi:hypothetical protein